MRPSYAGFTSLAAHNAACITAERPWMVARLESPEKRHAFAARMRHMLESPAIWRWF